MVSLRAIYRESIQEVVEFLNASAASLGLELLQPLEPEAYGWDCLRLAGEKLFASVCQPYNYRGCETMRWFDFRGSSRIEKSAVDVFHKLLSASLRPVEVLLVDHDIEFADGDFSYILPGEDPFAFLPTMESNYYIWGIHSLRALERGVAGSMVEWSLRARERGFGWSEREGYGILDVRWDEAGTPCSDRDPITGLATEDEFFAYLSSQAQGTVMVVSLSAVADRSFEAWCKVLPEVARLLEAQVAPGGLLTRLYSPRRFALLKPGLAVATLATLLREAFGEVRGQVLSVSWPDDTPADDVFFKACQLEETGEGEMF